MGPTDALKDQVSDSSEVVAGPSREVRVRLTDSHARDGPGPGIVLVHGAVVGGARDPRLVALARALAVRGAIVAAPELDSLARFHLDGDDPGRVSAVARWLSDRHDVRDHEVALVGISVGGSYVLVAAADARLEGRLSMILAFGAYEDLDRVLRGWLCTPRQGAPDLFDPLTEGRRLVLLGNVDVLVPEPDRSRVTAAIEGLAEGRDPGPPSGLSDVARFVLDVSRSTEPLSPADAERLLAPLASRLAALSPSSAPLPSRPKVYLLHGEGDPVIPTAELEHLRDTLERQGTPVLTHATALFQHVGTGTGETPSFFEAWPLLSFLADALADAGL